tara:strand:- start:500 stop:607 length:108 start_codon:yes stop_codon:yes gene_type:complete
VVAAVELTLAEVVHLVDLVVLAVAVVTHPAPALAE